MRKMYIVMFALGDVMLQYNVIHIFNHYQR